MPVRLRRAIAGGGRTCQVVTTVAEAMTLPRLTLDKPLVIVFRGKQARVGA